MAELPTALFPSQYQSLMDEINDYFNPENSHKLKVHEYKGFYFDPYFGEETIPYVCEEWQPRDTDIIVSSGAKCGTHWLGDIVRNILYGRDSRLDAMSKQYASPLCLLGLGPKSKFKILENLNLPRRYFFTHLSPQLYPMEKITRTNAKVLYIMRNPKDRLLSWYYFSSTFPFTREESLKDIFNKDWNIFFEDYISGRQPVHSRKGEIYEDHIKAWLPYRDQKNFKFLFFEDIKMDPQGKVEEIAEFIGHPLTKQEVENVVSQTSIDKAASDMQKEGTEDDKMKKKFKLVRKGKVGGWKTDSHMTEDQSARLDELVEQKLAGTGITFIYDMK